VTDPCYACAMTAQLETLPPREAVIVDGGWRVAHAFNSSLPGWLVVLPLRHLAALDELTIDEAASLGSLLRRLSAALADTVGSLKSYVMFFAEAEGFAHLHVHVVPRMEWFADDQVGPRVFTFLGAAESEWVDEARRDELAVALRRQLAVDV
jgi:diadenosine tetraphosphate (Ap4A) HIT family hydrolase